MKYNEVMEGVDSCIYMASRGRSNCLMHCVALKKILVDPFQGTWILLPTHDMLLAPCGLFHSEVPENASPCIINLYIAKNFRREQEFAKEGLPPFPHQTKVVKP